MSLWKKIDLTHPKVIYFITALAVMWVNMNIGSWRTRSVIQHDVSFYYSYLPSVFVYHDISQEFLNDPANEHLKSAFYFPPQTPEGNYVFKSTMGMALSYLPFFLAAHLYCHLTGEHADGYSPPYQLAVQFSSLVYFLIGLWFLYRVIRRYFSPSHTALSILLVIFGTNVFYYLTMGAGMSHAIDFALSCAFLYFTIKWHTEQTYYTSIRLGLIGGLITLIRPINILLYVFFLLYDIHNLQDVRKKFLLYKKRFAHLLIIGACGVVVFLPQLIYWRTYTGHWFFNSYVGEHFFFGNPHILEGLFSFRKGWLVYTPLMTVCLLGLAFLIKKHKEFPMGIIVMLVLYIYVAFSWWCWWYGGSFGQRSMIDIYPFLCLPLAAFLEYSTKHKAIKMATILVMSVLTAFNLFQTMQAKYNIIHFDSMTREAYLDALFRTSKDPEREKLLKHPDPEKAMRGEDEY